MSYKTYTTEGIVCGSSYSNTSDRSYLIFTKEAGMVYASARSVREERSKQRYALQDFSRIRVSLLKGKSGWRIGSAESLGNTFLRAQSREARGHVSFLIGQLRRYVQGEVPLTRVYNDVCDALGYADDQLHRKQVQRLFCLRLFHHLGYIAVLPAWKPLLETERLQEAVELCMPHMESAIDTALEGASQASHL